MSEYICDKLMLEYFSIDTGEWKTVRETYCKVKISKPRNVKHHRLVFSMLNYVLKNKVTHPNVNTTDRLLTAFKKAYGYSRQYTDIDGSNVTADMFAQGVPNFLKSQDAEVMPCN